MILTQIMVDTAKRNGYAMSGTFLYTKRKACELFLLSAQGAYRTFSRARGGRIEYLTHAGMKALLASCN